MAWFPELTERSAVAHAVKTSRSAREALECLGLPYNQRTRDALMASCRNYRITPNFPGRTFRMTDEEVFVENSPYLCNGVLLKRRFIAATGTPEECSECGQGPVWNGEPLVLQLDHINGSNTDHRFENLRLLCPNCHTQTSTYSGRVAIPAAFCQHPDCGRMFQPTRTRYGQPPRFCSRLCASRFQSQRRVRPEVA